MIKLRERHARILATIGPATTSQEMIEKLVASGADAFRLNFSHGDHSIHKQTLTTIRKVAKKAKRHIAIIQDLQGPKIRVGDMKKSVELEVGDTFRLDNSKEKGTKQRVHLPHPEILEVLKKDDKIYINDGIVRLTVTKTGKGFVETKVFAGGKVDSQKGVNLPGVDLPLAALTEKDLKDLEFGLSLGVDWVAMSFVQNAGDIKEVKARVQNAAGIIAKIEMPNAVERIDNIIQEADAIMVARGDLGVECPIEEVPAIQKRLINKCRKAGKPVIVATQMLESMIHNASPTRAEVSDVANATFEGADVLMLSAETATGKYPLEVVQTMDAIIRRVERSASWRPLMDARRPSVKTEIGDAIAHAAFQVAEELKACAVVTLTESGSTALRMSRQRPIQPIIVLTPHEATARRLALGWGLTCFCDDVPEAMGQVVKHAIRNVQNAGIGKEKQHIVITAGIPFGEAGSTNTLRVATI
jgi:pyruvate kinase